MKRFAVLFCAFLFCALSASAPALAQPAVGEGQRLFIQHCGLCHLKLQINMAAPFAPVLSKAIFENGRDAQIRTFIAEGTPNMPGFKYLFTEAQTAAIADYLKTVEAPAKPAPANR